MKRITLLLSALTIFAAYGVTPARECRDRALGTPREELKRSVAVFTGTVIDVTKPRPDEHMEGGRVVYEDRLYVYVKFRVEKSWKGVGKGDLTITIEAERDGYGCGYDFTVGTYLVYADGIGRGRAKRLWVGCCTRTRRIDEAGGDLRELGAGKAIGVGTKSGVTKPDNGMQPDRKRAGLSSLGLAVPRLSARRVMPGVRQPRSL
jgi:hypothetical protein